MRILALNPDLTRIELRNTAVGSDSLQELAAHYPGCEFVLETGPPFRARR